jgi:hypothetical protein
MWWKHPIVILSEGGVYPQDAGNVWRRMWKKGERKGAGSGTLEREEGCCLVAF